MATVDISGLLFFMPIFSFLFVFIVVFSILSKTKLLRENKFINLLISFILAIIFSTATGTRKYIETTVPWIVVLIICLFFVLLLVGISQKEIDKFLKPQFTWIFVVGILIVFIIAAINVFSSIMNPLWERFYEIITTREKIYGSLLLIVIAAIVSWVLAKK